MPGIESPRGRPISVGSHSNFYLQITTKDTNFTKRVPVVLVLSAAVLGSVAPRGGHGMTRMITDDHGKGDGVELVLSKAVLVIVIDARDVGRWGWRAGGMDHERHEFHEKRSGRTRTQRSGARSTFRCHQRRAALLGPSASPLHPTIGLLPSLPSQPSHLWGRSVGDEGVTRAQSTLLGRVGTSPSELPGRVCSHRP